jgi:hypothetical protein
VERDVGRLGLDRGGVHQHVKTAETSNGPLDRCGAVAFAGGVSFEQQDAGRKGCWVGKPNVETSDVRTGVGEGEADFTANPPLLRR